MCQKFINLFKVKAKYFNLTNNLKTIKLKGLNNIITIKTNLKVINKIRYIDIYNNQRLFQNTFNEQIVLDKKFISRIINFFKKNYRNYDCVVFLDYGYSSIFKELIQESNIFKNKLYINCQTNSYNFGYNLADKFLGGELLLLDELEFRLLVKNKSSPIIDLIRLHKNKLLKFKKIIITQGKYGCYVFTKNYYKFIPAVNNKIVDTTGCGDIFFMSYLISNFNKYFSEEEKCIFSHIVAGIHANSLGNRMEITRDSILKYSKSILS